MTYMKSTASNDGSASISVFFKLGTNPDQAAVNVQNRVAQVTSQLPAEVVQAGITTNKQQNSMIMVLDLYSEDRNLYNETFIQNYTKINILPEIKRVPGVGSAQVFGTKDYAIRIWLKPQQLAAYNLTPQEVIGAIQDQSLEAAPGKFGENSGEALEYVIKYKGKLNTPEQYENLVIRSNADGSVLYLKDLARIEFGSSSYSNDNRVNGKDGAVMGIFQTAGSNANEILIAIGKVLENASKSFPKGIKYDIVYSTKNQLDNAISQVKTTLIEAFILVFIIVFIFLQDFRSTLIPAIAVPVSLIGTFFFLQLMGFSINMLTLFALVLAIGIVVDDAIVVVEAVHSKMERTRLPAKQATYAAMSEITGAIISITLVMAAVFLPVGFMEGPAGVFYRQFAFTLATAILISAVNALTLSPALCALFLKNIHAGEGEEKGARKRNFNRRFYSAFNSGFKALTAKYTSGVRFLIRNRWVGISFLALVIATCWWLMRTTPKGFIPNEDDNFVVFALALPPGASLDRTTQVLQNADVLLEDQKAIQSTITISGFNMLSNSSSSAYAMGFVNLRPIHERGPVNQINDVLGMLQEKLAPLNQGNFSVFTMPTVPGFGAFNGLEFVLQDRAGGSITRFSEMANGFLAELRQQKEIGSAFTLFKADFPQLEIEVDNIRARQLGVNIHDLMITLQAYYGSMQATDFNRFGKYYRVYVQADIPYRNDPSSFNGIFVKNQQGQMVPVNSIVKLNHVYGPEAIDRYNLFNSITVNASPAPGFSTGDAMKAVERIASKKLPQGFSYEWTGLSKEENESGNQMLLIFGLSILFVYFLLSAQYESYILPLCVILSIPTGILGVFTAIRLAGIDNNIYVQVGLIMLIGLLAKNAILIVEFALQRRKAGQTLLSSALDAAALRLRPILMTSLAFVVGLIPLMYVRGGTAQGNHSISIGTAGGMLSGVLLGIFIIPVLFIIFQYLQEKVHKMDHPEENRPGNASLNTSEPF